MFGFEIPVEMKVNGFNDAVKSYFLRLREKENLEITDIRLNLSFDHNGDILYTLHKKGINGVEKIRTETINKILNVGMVDVFGKCAMVTEIMSDILINLCEDNTFKANEIGVMIYTKKMTGEPLLYLYNQGKPVKELNLLQLLS